MVTADKPLQSHKKSSTFILLVVDDNGKVIFHYGLSEQKQLHEKFEIPNKNLAYCNRRTFTLETDKKKYVGVSAPLDNGFYALLISDCTHLEELTSFISSVDFSFDILNKLISSPFDGMSVVDANARIVYLSSIHEKFFGLSRGEATGCHVTEVIENTRLHKVVKSGVAEIAHMQHVQGTSRIVSRIPIIRDGKIEGAVGRVMFKGPDQLIEMSKELSKLKTEVEYYKRENFSLRNRTYGLENIIGSSDAIRKLKQNIKKVSEVEVPVLITGESGTGKELIAQAIHQHSLRRDNSMVLVNAAALPENLVESELFGYESGAFTGAQRQGRPGKFEAAHNSTLFLDEIGDMPLNVQVKLLRVLQNGTFERIGGNNPKHADFRLVTATNRPLQKMIENEEFRLDLFYRISGVVLHAPPLRDRLDDIPELVEHFFVSFTKQHKTVVRKIHPEVFSYLKSRPWPGNVRQLAHEVERALIFCDGPILRVEDFEPLVVMDTSEPETSVTTKHANETLKDAIEKVELETIKESMDVHLGNKKKVAEVLGISRSYLYKRLRDLGSL